MADAVVTGADSVRHTGGGSGRGVLGSSGVAVTTTAQIAADSALAGTYARNTAPLVGFIGNSITLGAGASQADTATGNVLHGEAPATYAMMAGDGRWELGPNAGVSGQTSTQIAARLQSDIISAGCNIAVLGEIFRNDPAAAIPIATTQANVVAMVNACRAAGVQPVLTTATPDDPTTPSTSTKTFLAKITSWVLAYGAANGIPVVDWMSPLVDPATGNVAVAYRSAAADVHPNAAGNALLGAAVDAALRQIVRPVAPSLVTNLNDGIDILSGAGLFLGTPASGIAAGWTSSLVTGCVATITTDTAVLGNMQRLTATGTASDSFIGSAFVSTGYSIGDTVEVSGIVTVGGGSRARIQVNMASGTPYGSLKTCQVATAVTRGRFKHRFIVPSGTTSLRVLLFAGTGTGYVEYGQITLRNRTVLGLS